jgi:hypothetical protein
MRLINKLIKNVLLALLFCLPLLSSAQEKYAMSQNKNYFFLEKIITGSASKLGISEAKVTVTPAKEGSVQAIITYKDNEEKILFTRDEVENASKGIFSSKTQRKINEAISQLPPRINPPLKPRN